MASTEEKPVEYEAVCEKCAACMDEASYVALEARSRLRPGVVRCPRCGGRDWRFETLSD